MLLYTKLAAPKVPKRRSRAGCTYCKEKKKKCDEIRPQCARCAERGQDCSYEPVRPRQRKKRDSALESVKSTSPTSTDQSDQLLDAHDWREGPEGIRADVGVAKFDPGREPAIEEIESPTSPDDPTMNWCAASDEPLISPLEASFGHLPLSYTPLVNGNNHEEDEEDVDEEIVRTAPVVPQMAVARNRRRQPDLAMISPAPLGSPHLEFVMPAFSEFSDCANRRALVDHFANVLSHLIVLRETETGNPFQHLVLPLCYSSSTVQNAIYALSSAHLEHRGSNKSEEKSLYFHNQAIQGLARLIKMGPNADREELLASIMLLVYFEVLVQRGRSNIVDGHLKGAMTIMSQNDQNSTPTSAFLERAFRFYDVIAALSFGTAPLSTAPAAGCLHPVSPLDNFQGSSLSSVDTLLGLSTTLWPILHRLSNLLSLKQELETALTSPATHAAKLAVLRTEFETTAGAIQAALENWHPSLPDGLTLADLDVHEEAEFLNGDVHHETPGRAHLQSILHNALAYRHSAFVHLYRTIHGNPRHHPSVQRHAHASLTHCVATVSHGGPMGALLWPLFVAACEAVDPEDRDLARQAFAAIDKRQGMTNIERGWIIVQEVWRRSDFMDAEGNISDDALAGDCAARSRNHQQRQHQHQHQQQTQQHQHMIPSRMNAGCDLWRRVSQDMGVTIVFG